jgi:hypothetical protein
MWLECVIRWLKRFFKRCKLFGSICLEYIDIRIQFQERIIPSSSGRKLTSGTKDTRQTTQKRCCLHRNIAHVYTQLYMMSYLILQRIDLLYRPTATCMNVRPRRRCEVGVVSRCRLCPVRRRCCIWTTTLGNTSHRCSVLDVQVHIVGQSGVTYIQQNS